MKHLFILVSLAISVFATAWAETTQIDEGWQFRLQDQSVWHNVNLPHDWSIEGTYRAENAMGNDGGYLPDGIGYYRRVLKVPASDQGRRTSLYFEGSYMLTTVYMNGDSIDFHPYGYTSFSVDLTPYLKYGADNELLVRVDNTPQKNCRWYSGSGLFRHVKLIRTDATHLQQWGTFVTTPQVNETQAEINVRATVCNEGTLPRTVNIRSSIEDGTRAEKTLTLLPGSQQEVSLSMTLKQPKLWSPDAPNLYKLTTCLLEEGRELDCEETRFGVRTLSYTAERGFELNGKAMAVYGGCIHHDNGILGAAAFDRAEERKVELMKQAGFNCVRTSHNPVSEAFLEACDRLGLMVVDESFDMWQSSKNNHDYHEYFDEYWQQDIRALVLRDRNHPSIICWSVGNEIIERKEIRVVTTAHKLSELCRSLDPTRPVTEAMAAWDKDWEIYDPLAAQHEVVGYNYMIHKAESDHERVPDRVIWQTESYPRDAFNSWQQVNDHSYVIGDFVWTAIDYLGESGIGRYYYEGETPGEHYQGIHYPWHGAYCGDIDLTGWRKPISYYRQLLFDPEHSETLHMAVREPDGYWGKIKETYWSVWPTWDSWNWPGWEGKEIEVEVYTRQPSVRLYLNDKLIGEQPVSRETEYKATFKVPYEEGTLRAESGEQSICLSTAGEPYAIRLTPDRSLLKADGQDLAFITLEVVDRLGRICPNAEVELDAKVSGKAMLAAFGNANLKECDSYLNLQHRTWKGRALLVLRSTGKAGSYQLSVSGKDLKGGSVKGMIK